MSDSREKSALVSPVSIGASAVLHALVFAVALAAGKGGCSRPPKEIEPVEMTVVLHENLDKPPDTLKNEPKPVMPKKIDPPKPEPKKIEPPPKVDEKTDAIEKKVDPPKPPPKKVEPPKKKEFKKGQRVEEKNPPKEQPPPKKEFKRGSRVAGNGPRTDRKLSPDEIKRLLAMGAKEGTRNQIAPNEISMCYGNIQRAFREAWDRPAWRQGLQVAEVQVSFAPGGRVTGTRLVKSSGDAQVDDSIRRAAARVTYVPGLTADFIRRCSPVKVEFELTAE